MDKKDYYEVLGVNVGMDRSGIKAAYRKLAMEYHPDRNLDETTSVKDYAAERFKEVTEAWEVLGDNDKRKEYDETGECGVANQLDQEAEACLINLFLTLVMQGQFQVKNYLPIIERSLRGQLENRIEDDDEIEGQLTKIEVLAKTIVVDEGEVNVLLMAVEDQLKGLHAQVEAKRKEVKVIDRALEMLAVYRYDGPEEPTLNTGNRPFLFENHPFSPGGMGSL